MSDLPELAAELHSLRQQRRAITGQEQDIEQRLADLMDADQINLGDKITLERRRGNIRKGWQSTELVNRLRTITRFSTETGEEVDPETHMEQFVQALKDCVPFTKSLGWKSGGLREWGTDPDEWATVEPGRVSVKVEIANT